MSEIERGISALEKWRMKDPENRLWELFGAAPRDQPCVRLTEYIEEFVDLSEFRGETIAEALSKAAIVTNRTFELLSKLLPCPLCGSSASVFERVPNAESDPYWVTLECVAPDCIMSIENFSYDPHYIDQVIEQWNKRAEVK